MDKNLQIGLRIKQRREQLNMTQEELGKKLGVNKSTIQRYECGKVATIKLPILDSLAIYLDVNPNWLALKTDNMEPDKKAPADDWSELSGMLAAVPADKLEQLTKTIELMSQNPDSDWLGLVELLAQVPKSDYVLVEGFLRGVTAKGGQDK